MRTLELTRCPTCGEPDAGDLELGGGVVLRRCLACTTVFAPAYAAHDEVFVDGYLSDGDTGAFGIDISHPRFQDFLLDIGARRAAALQDAAGGPGTLLDVGCGSGELLAAARDRGWTVTGVEPLADASAHARARRLDVHTGTLDEVAALLEHRYDVVTAFHVLEHMSDAPAFLRSLARCARPGGLVAVETPNFASVLRKRRRANWPHLRPLEHLIHFTPQTIAVALRNAGLEPLRVTTPSYLYRDSTLEEALVHLAREDLARVLAPLSPHREVLGHRARVPSAPARAILRAVSAAYERRGVGSAVLAIARVGPAA